MKKLNSIKKTFFATLAIAFTAIVVTGCTTLTYTGTDYMAKNAAVIKTDENFIFSTYNKTLTDAKVDVNMGITKSSSNDALILYVGVDNTNNASDYVIYSKDFTAKAQNTTLTFVPSNEYITSYQEIETKAIAGLSTVSPGLGTLATIATTYRDVTRTNKEQSTSNVEALNQIKQIATNISAHSLNTAGVVKAKQKGYFYLFLKDPQSYPITLSYKGLDYSFSLK